MMKICDTAKGGLQEQAREFLARLLRDKVVQAVLAAKARPGGKSAAPVLVSDPEKLDGVEPFAPVQSVNAARVLMELTKPPAGAEAKKESAPLIAALIRPCEVRATIELFKLKQAQAGNLLLIGFDCPGAYDAKKYAELADTKKAAADLLRKSSEQDPEELRTSCRLCVHFVAEGADVNLCWMGGDGGLLAEALTDKGKESLKKLNAKEADKPKGRDAAIKKKLSERAARLSDAPEKLMELLEPCLRCYNCREACPICYCKECLLKSEKMGHTPERHLGRAAKKGQIKMPPDTVLFHLTKMNHMATSCVACGLCEQACPMGIPLGRIYSLVGRHAQALFNYVPGRSLSDELPVATFREDELPDVEDVKKDAK